MRNSIYIIVLIIFFACSLTDKSPDALLQQHCGTCHIAPKPEDLPKAIWAEKILPDMGARLGMETDGFDPMANLSWNERVEIMKRGIYSIEAKMEEEEWEKLKTYILSIAPDSIATETNRHQRHERLTTFLPQPIALDSSKGAYISFLEFEEKSRRIITGDVYANVMTLQYGERAERQYKGKTPIVAYTERDSGAFVTEIGQMPPTDLGLGVLVYQAENQSTIAQGKLKRPVHTLIKDLNGDGKEEIFICEYGNQVGCLSMLKKDHLGKYQKTVLFPLPGVIRVVPKDINEDGKEDLIVLAAQGDEGVYILYQEEALTFLTTRAIRFNPVFGTSWMEVVDYNRDGHQDIITVQGDNADQSFCLKPYHGLRIFINNGKNDFEEQFFYPLYGATRVVAKDFDQDGDCDFAIAAYFPDFEQNAEEAFVYLENLNSPNFQFKSYTFPEAVKGRWLIMDAGDVDDDGDTDIILGSFAHNPSPTPKNYLMDWKNNWMDLMILENLLVNRRRYSF